MKLLWIEPEKSLVGLATEQLPSNVQLSHLSTFNDLQFEQTVWPEIDILTLELKYEGMPPFRLIEEARKKNPDIKVILITGSADKEHCIQAINSGVNGFLEKPFDSGRFQALIERFVRHSDELPLNQDRKAVFSENRWIDLTSTEYRILETLKLARRRLTRAELQSAVWPSSSISDNNLDTHLTNLKRKIPSLNQYLNVKRGLGYFLTIRKSNA